jgi:osmotically-inducible protein OsmY
MNAFTSLQEEVENELRWDPQVHAERIGVSILDGVVQLDGHADSLYEKWAAESAVLRLRDVRALANDIEVDIPVPDQQSDATVAESILNQFQWNCVIPDEVKVSVSNGWVILEGSVGAEYQRCAADAVVRWTKGVKGIVNRIEINPKVNVTVFKEAILDAIRRNAILNVENIGIENDGGVLTLQGHVGSWLEKDEARRVAWSSPGVTRVIDLLTFEQVPK